MCQIKVKDLLDISEWVCGPFCADFVSFSQQRVFLSLFLGPQGKERTCLPTPTSHPSYKTNITWQIWIVRCHVFYPTELWRMFVGNWGLFYKQSWQLACLFILVTGGLSKVVKTWVIEGGDVWACVWGVGKWLWRQLVKCLFSYGGPD